MAKEKKIVKVKDLPYYKKDEEKTAFVEDPPLPLEGVTAGWWQFIRPSYYAATSAYGTGSKWWKGFQKDLRNYPEYFEDEERKVTVAKVAAITVGGMGGYLYGMKRGGPIRRAFHAGVGMAVLGAFCYPHETMDFSRNFSKFLRAPWSGPRSLDYNPPEARYPPLSGDKSTPECKHPKGPDGKAIVPEYKGKAVSGQASAAPALKVAMVKPVAKPPPPDEKPAPKMPPKDESVVKPVSKPSSPPDESKVKPVPEPSPPPPKESLVPKCEHPKGPDGKAIVPEFRPYSSPVAKSEAPTSKVAVVKPVAKPSPLEEKPAAKAPVPDEPLTKPVSKPPPAPKESPVSEPSPPQKESLVPKCDHPKGPDGKAIVPEFRPYSPPDAKPAAPTPKGKA